tara:strand:+ start:483 stop:971 length:489 start_codon:yes stop_codon:yes gene_type:complete
LFIGVTGDTHNNLKNISKICDIFNEIKPSFVIHTGDITLPKSIKAFSKLKMPLIGVFGNNDEGEKKDLIVESKKYNFKLHEEPLFIEKENIKIAVVHHPELINEKMTKEMDFILHGHTHKFRSELINKALIFNPGECAGIMKGKNNIGLIDTKRKDSKIISF